MSVLRITRFTTDPDQAASMLTARDALVRAVRSAHKGLESVTPARLDDRTWLDLWTWRSRAHLQAAGAAAPRMPAAAAAFALVTDVTVEVADLQDRPQLTSRRAAPRRTRTG